MTIEYIQSANYQRDVTTFLLNYKVLWVFFPFFITLADMSSIFYYFIEIILLNHLPNNSISKWLKSTEGLADERNTATYVVYTW
jgi:hypothetical protein